MILLNLSFRFKGINGTSAFVFRNLIRTFKAYSLIVLCVIVAASAVFIIFRFVIRVLNFISRILIHLIDRGLTDGVIRSNRFINIRGRGGSWQAVSLNGSPR